MKKKKGIWYVSHSTNEKGEKNHVIKNEWRMREKKMLTRISNILLNVSI